MYFEGFAVVGGFFSVVFLTKSGLFAFRLYSVTLARKNLLY